MRGRLSRVLIGRGPPGVGRRTVTEQRKKTWRLITWPDEDLVRGVVLGARRKRWMKNRNPFAAGRFSVSRTPVREAAAGPKLCASGLIDGPARIAARFGGRAVDRAALTGMFEAMAELRGECAQASPANG